LFEVIIGGIVCAVIMYTLIFILPEHIEQLIDLIEPEEDVKNEEMEVNHDNSQRNNY